MNNESQTKIKQLKIELEELYKELEDNELLKKYYSGAIEIEKDLRSIIKTYERQIKIIKLFEDINKQLE